MSTMTAQILIGNAHPYDGGINPRYSMLLSENGVAQWTLVSADLSSNKKNSNKIVAQWIPTIENMLEDAFLMIGLYVMKDEELIRLASKHLPNKLEPHLALYEDAEERGLEILRERARKLEQHFKITISIFYGSTIMNQYHVVEKYNFDTEICLPIYAREYSLWSKKMEERGSLRN